MRFPFALCGLLAAMAAGGAQALEYKSVGPDPVIAYDAPAVKGARVYAVPRGMPIEVVFTNGDWTKVRDSAGSLFWLESKNLTPKRTLVVKVANAKIHAAADDGSPLSFTADKGVLLDMAEPASSGWVKVKHRDGQTGYVKSSEVWGSD